MWRWVEMLLVAVLSAGSIAASIDHPRRFWQDAWLPMSLVAALVIIRWYARRKTRRSSEPLAPEYRPASRSSDGDVSAR